MPQEPQLVDHGVEMIVPKYGKGLNYGINEFGGNGIAAVTMEVTDSEHTLIAAQPDVVSVPPLDSRLNTAQFNRFQTWCEARGIPSDKFNSNMTIFRILSTMVRMFMFHQRLNGIGLSQIGTNLDRQIGALPLSTRQRLQSAIVSFGWDDKYLNNNLSLRDVCKQVGDFYNKRVRFGEIDE